MPLPTLCPFATPKLLAVNFGGPIGEILGLVVHVEVGGHAQAETVAIAEAGSLYGWFSNPTAQVSSHLWIDATGQLEQYVPFDATAWAQEAGNENYLSVETEGQVDEPLSYASQGTLAGLIAWLHLEFGVPLALVDHGGRGVTTHAHYPSGDPDPAWGGHPCPGLLRELQLPKILRAAQAIAEPI